MLVQQRHIESPEKTKDLKRSSKLLKKTKNRREFVAIMMGHILLITCHKN